MDELRSGGSKLFTKFNELGIETGKLGEIELSAWYDTFDSKQRDFLDWFQRNITTDNCLTFSETLAQKELEDKNLMLHGSKLEAALKACEKSHPGVLDHEANQYECELYEFELEYYQEEIKYLKQEIIEENEKYQELIDKKSDQMKLLLSADFNRDEALSVCLKYAKELDDLNTSIVANVEKIENHHDFASVFLCNYDNGSNHPDKSLALENIQSFVTQKQNGERTFGGLCQGSGLEDSVISMGSCNLNSDSLNDRSYDELFDFNRSACEFTQRNGCSNSALEDAPRELVKRLIDAFALNVDVTRRVQILSEQIKFLQQDNLIARLNQYRFMSPRRDNPNQSAEQLKSCVSLYTQLITLPTTRMSEIEVEALNSDIAECVRIESKLDQLIQYELLQLDWFTYEFETLSGFHSLMQFLRAHVIDLQHIEERVDLMRATISECSDYCAKPFEATWHPLREILEAIRAPPDLALKDALEAVGIFEAKCVALEKKIFIDDVDANAKELKQLANFNKALMSQLSTKETGEMVIIPGMVYDALRSANRAMEDCAKEMKYLQGLPKVYAKQLEADERKRIKRQLWMYFLIKPEKLQQLEEKYKREKRSECAAFFQSQP